MADIIASVDAPPLPRSNAVVGLKVDPNTHRVGLDQDALMNMLKGLRSYTKELAERGMTVMRSDLEAEGDHLRKEIKLAAEEVQDEMQRKCEVRFEAIDSDRETLSIAINQLRSELAALSTRVSEGFQRQPTPAESQEADPDEDMEAAESEAQDDSSRLPSRAPAEATSETPVGEAQLRNPIEVPSTPPHRQSSPQDVASASHLDMVASRVESINAELNDRLELEIDRMSERLEREVRLVNHRMDAVQKRTEATGSEVERLTPRLVGLEAFTQGLQQSTNQALDLKADAEPVQKMQDELLICLSLKEEVKAIGPLENRVTEQEHGLAALSGVNEALERLFLITDENRSAGEQTAGKLEEFQREATATDEMLRSALQESHDSLQTALAAQADESRARHDETDSHLVKLDDITSDVVHLPDFLAMREIVGAISHQLKEKEQSVLFGARCLSCNTVFDDVQTQAGTVDTRGEKQRALLFSEMQRALHGPNSDTSQEIKMVAVQVGRSAQLPGPGGTGPFEGRQTRFACSVEDLALLKPTVTSAIDDKSTGNRLSTAHLAKPPSSPAGSPRRRREHPAPPPGPSPSSALFGVGTRHSPLIDFRHQLSDLVGRRTLKQ